MFLIRALILVLAVIGCGELRAQQVPLFFSARVVPENPVAGQFLELDVGMDPCREFMPPTGTVATAGSHVTVTMMMENTVLCGTPPPEYHQRVPLGGFAAGTYSVELRAISAIPGVTYAPITASFTVGAASAIPALAPWPMLGLMLVLGVLAWWRFHGHSG